jgi:hypothetical protein
MQKTFPDRFGGGQPAQAPSIAPVTAPPSPGTETTVRPPTLQLPAPAGTSTAPGGGLQTKPVPSGIPINAADLGLWFNPDSPDLLVNPPRGTTAAEAEAGGFRRVRPNQQEKLVTLQSALEVMDEVELLIDKVFPETETPIKGRIKGAGERTLKAFLQSDVDVVALQRITKAFAALMARAGGEKGALNEGDVQRAMEAFPKLTDRADVARNQMRIVRKILRDGAARSIGRTSSSLKLVGQRRKPSLKLNQPSIQQSFDDEVNDILNEDF